MSLNLRSIQRDSDRTPFEFHVDEHSFTFPAHFPLFAAEHLSKGEPFEALRLLVGDDDYELLERVFGRELDEKVLEVLFEDYMKHLGMDPGESSASTDS